jgi:tRNA 2-selenouridine synthase
MGEQPSQKAFESALAGALCRLDPARPVLVEAESSKIGQILVPPSLWDGMKVAPWIELLAPLEARTDYLLRAYDDILSDRETLQARLAPLKAHRGEALVAEWTRLSAAGDKRALTRSLMEDHYDLAYAKSMKAMAPQVMARITAEGLKPSDLEQVAGEVAAALQAMEI